MMRSFTGVSTLAILLVAAAASARAQATWQSTAAVDADGERSASLAFGVPETDAQLLIASCRPDMPGQVQVWLNLPLSPDAPAGAASVSFAVNRQVEARPALVEAGGGEEKDGPRISLVLGHDDPLWQLLMAGTSSRLSADGSTWVDMHLTGSRAAISQFLRGCETLAVATPAPSDPADQPSALVALPGPLYEVGAEPAEATSAFSGAALPSFEPGTELMGTGSSNMLGGEEWIEVRPGRGSGPAAWVLRSALTPISGGAPQYENLNQAANLMLRGAPNADASPVGAVPPRAIVVDQGQREGPWVLVRFGDIVGWASHDYLLPMVPATSGDVPAETEIPLDEQGGVAGGEPTDADATPDDGVDVDAGSDVDADGTVDADVDVDAGREAAGGEEIADLQSYRVTRVGWEVACDPCASAEDTVCSLSSGELPNTFAVVADDIRPQRVGDLRIGMDLPPDPQGTLTVTVDGAQVVAIPPADITYMAMTGEFLLQPPYIDPVLTSMIGGSTVAVAFVGADGGVHSFSLPLAGFSAGITDLLATSPQYPRDSACRM